MPTLTQVTTAGISDAAVTSTQLATSITLSGNITAGNLVGRYANGTSNINIPAINGNVNISAVGNANVLVITGTGANIIGTANITGNANVANIGATNGVFTAVTSATITETSSIALKANINPITGALELIQQLVGVTYDRVDGSKKNEAGLVAEEVEKVLPNLIGYDENGKPIGIHYTKLTAYLIEAVKELTDKIKRLENK